MLFCLYSEFLETKMLFQMINLIQKPLFLVLYIVLLIIPLLFSIAFHEFAHGYVAYKFGDLTPKLMGRLTLNPFKHLDVLGTILLLIVGLGWAKPVIINLQNVPNQTKQMLIALAGPVSNFSLALLFSLLIYFFQYYKILFFEAFIITLFDKIVLINIVLALFNLIPIPPLDGSRIVTWLLPEKLKYLYNKYENYGLFIMLLILFTIGFSWLFNYANILKQELYIFIGITI